MRRRGGRGLGFLHRPMLCRRLRWRRRFGGARRLRLRNTNAGKSDYSDKSRNFCYHIKASVRRRRDYSQSNSGATRSGRHPRRNRSTGLERAGRLRYPLPGGPDSGMPQVGCGGLYRRLCPDETVRGQSNPRRHSQTSVQNTADQARNIRVIDIRSGAFRFSLAARAEIGLIRLRQGYGRQRLA